VGWAESSRNRQRLGGVRFAQPTPTHPSSPRHRNVLRLQELHQAFVRALAADARLLHAAEGRGRIGDEPRGLSPIMPKVRAWGFGDAACRDSCPWCRDRRRDRILVSFRALDHLALGFEALDRGDGPRKFLRAAWRRPSGTAVEHGRRIENTRVPLGALPPVKNFRALADPHHRRARSTFFLGVGN